jgi:hypothetical protein
VSIHLRPIHLPFRAGVAIYDSQPIEMKRSSGLADSVGDPTHQAVESVDLPHWGDLFIKQA